MSKFGARVISISTYHQDNDKSKPVTGYGALARIVTKDGLVIKSKVVDIPLSIDLRTALGAGFDVRTSFVFEADKILKWQDGVDRKLEKDGKEPMFVQKLVGLKPESIKIDRSMEEDTYEEETDEQAVARASRLSLATIMDGAVAMAAKIMGQRS